MVNYSGCVQQRPFGKVVQNNMGDLVLPFSKVEKSLYIIYLSIYLFI